jgi:uncharacterized membrane protein YgcG
MTDSAPSPPFAVRLWLVRLAWVLLAISLLIPPPAGSFSGGGFSVSAFYVFGKAIVWSEALPGSPASLGFWRGAVLALALFSQGVCIFVPLMLHVRRVSNTWKVFLVALLAIDASIAFLIPELERLPAYWIWLASIAAMVVAFVVFPGDEELRTDSRSLKRRSPLDRGEVTPFFWFQLGATLCWVVVSAINYGFTRAGGSAVATNAPLSAYVTDWASLLTRDEAAQLSRTLERFANETSTQIAIAIYPRVPEGSIEEFTMRIADRSRVGASGPDNGAILFAFMDERAARLEVGYGLESTITDVDAHHILESDLGPALARSAFFEGFETTSQAIFGSVQSAEKDGRAQGGSTLWKKKAEGGLRKMLENPLIALGQIGLVQRIAITFMGGIVGAMFWQGIGQWLLLARDGARGLGNLLARRPVSTGMEVVNMDAIGAPLAMLAWTLGMLIPAASFLALAAGGTFGGAGALIHW